MGLELPPITAAYNMAVALYVWYTFAAVSVIMATDVIVQHCMQVC